VAQVVVELVSQDQATAWQEQPILAVVVVVGVLNTAVTAVQELLLLDT
jgi:hypothetical protein